MKKRFLGTIAALAVAALALGAVPAFTADNGTINVTVTAAAAASPCVEFATPPGTQVGFGTLPFSTPAQVSDGFGDVAPRFRNCSTTATESFLIVGTDAPPLPAAATWTLGGGTGNSCPSTNVFRLFYNTDNVGSWPITKSGAPLRNLATGATTFAPGEAHDLGLEIVMPCQGSDGAGQTLSLSVTLTAQIV